MKKKHLFPSIILSSVLFLTAFTFVNDKTTEDPDGVFIVISDDNVFSKCFTPCDLNGDKMVSYAEAEKATKLILDYGGRKNIISDYGFLSFFPNLTHLSIGNTPNEAIDLSANPKLEVLDLRGGLWITEVTLAIGCNPQIFFPIHEQPVTFKRVHTK